MENLDNDDLLNDEPGKNLKPKYLRFCLEYLKDYNVSAAARRAGFSASSAYDSGARLLKLPEVDEFLQYAMRVQQAEMGLAPQASFKKMVEVSNLEHGEFLDEHGDIKNLKELPEELRQAVHVQTKRIKTDDHGTTITTYSLSNKIQLLENISKRLPKESTGIAPNNETDSFAILPDGTEREF